MKGCGFPGNRFAPSDMPTEVNIIALILYAAVGICVMSFKEDWTLVTSFYVTVQIITTVGYGDIAPTESGELFLIFYVLLGTVLLAGLLGSPRVYGV